MWQTISYFLTFCSGVVVTVIGGLIVIWINNKLYKDTKRTVAEEVTDERLYSISQKMADFELGLVRLEAALLDFGNANNEVVDLIKKEIEALKAGQLRLYRVLNLSPEEEVMTCSIESKEQGSTGLLKGD